MTEQELEQMENQVINKLERAIDVENIDLIRELHALLNTLHKQDLRAAKELLEKHDFKVIQLE